MRRDSLADDLADRGDDAYVPPAYGDYGFHRVPNTAFDVLGADTGDTLPGDVFDGVDTDVSNVVVVLLDGFGYDQWRAAEPAIPLLERLADAGTVTPLTSTYPSETAAAITTLHTGVTPREHGVLGWFQSLDALGAVVAALPWTTFDGDPVDEAFPDAPEWADALLDASTVYERAEGVDSAVVEPEQIIGSASDGGLSVGATGIPYYGVADMAVRVRERLEAVDAGAASYTLAYVPDLDAVAHEDGPGTAATRAQAESLAAAVERELVGRLDPAVAADTLFVLTADHGHVDTGGENVDLRGYDPLWDHVRAGADGEPIPPVGSPRNLQLHLEDGTVGRVREAFERDFDCRTYTREEYVDAGLFGPVRAGSADGEIPVRAGSTDGEIPSGLGRAFAERAPDLVCVHASKGMWYADEHLGLIGQHGGQTRAEMLVPFAAARLDEVA